MSRISKKQLEQLLEELSEVSGLPLAGKDSKTGLSLEYSSVYGGYRLVMIGESGGHSGVFGFSSVEGRVNAQTIHKQLKGLIQGIEFGKSLKK